MKRGFTLLEVMVAAAILMIGVMGLLATQQQATRYSAEAELRGQLELLAQSVLEEATQMPLVGPTGLFQASSAPANGLVVSGRDLPGHPGNPYPANLVAVVRCKGDPNDISKVDPLYLVDLEDAGLPPGEVACVRIHVQAFVAANPDALDADALTPLLGAGVPAPVDLVAYRLVD